MAQKKADQTVVRPTNRVRFVMLDADLSETNLSELTQAITSALQRSAPAPQGRIPPMGSLAAPALKNGENGQNGHATATEEEHATDVEAETEESVSTTPSLKVPRKPPTPPTFQQSLFTTETAATFKAFTVQHATKKQSNKYLLAALFLRDELHQSSVNANAMYTAYRTAGWSTKITDWDANFRYLVKEAKMHRVSPGEYTITPPGEAVVQELASA